MKVVFDREAWQQYLHWQRSDPVILAKLNLFIEECSRTPFRGLGRPEPLKNDLKGWWSRRLTQEDRLIYRVTGTAPNQTLEIIQCRFHY